MCPRVKGNFNLSKLLVLMKKNLFLVSVFASLFVGTATQAVAYPMYAQQGYENPREATGRIVCATVTLLKSQ